MNSITQIVTGLTLAMHYIAHADMAFESVEHIMRDVNYGWLIRLNHLSSLKLTHKLHLNCHIAFQH